MSNTRKAGVQKIQALVKAFTSLTLCAFAALALSCQTEAAAARRLEPPLSVRNFRLNDIQKHLTEDPAAAVHLLEVYRIIYGENTFPDGSDAEVQRQIETFRSEALQQLETVQQQAIDDQRWTDAVSLARSRSRVDSAPSSANEQELLLQYAKEQLSSSNNLSAFLAAAEAHRLQPLSFDDALAFLQRAVEVRQRGTAAFFLNIINTMGGNRAAAVPAELLAYARGRDTAADRIKGAATVWVDRGIRIERGMGFPDRVLGSAFFVDASGLLITNYHVIASEVDPAFRGFSRLFVRMGDAASPRIPARVIGWDQTLDLALIKTEITPEYVYSVVDWAMPEVGDAIQAIGSPVGLENTVTQGIVSALGRRFLQIGDVIQIDAAVNQGNSGGPVIDMSGRLVGVVFAGIDRHQGLNFAIPAERLAAALPAMLGGGSAERPWLGLAISETPHGAEITYVAPFTPAAEQQIREGSIIKAINGQELRAPQGRLIPAVQDKLFSLSPGELVTLELVTPRGDTVQHVIKLARRPAIPMADAAQKDSRERMVAPLFGMILSMHGGGSFSSFIVQRVVRGSIADQAGISEDDTIYIRGFRIIRSEGVALLDISIKKRRMGYLEAVMRLPALLDTPDTL